MVGPGLNPIVHPRHKRGNYQYYLKIEFTTTLRPLCDLSSLEFEVHSVINSFDQSDIL